MRYDLDVDILVMNSHDAVLKKHLNQDVNYVDLHTSNARFAFFPLLRYIRKHQPDIFLVFNYELAVLILMLRTLFNFKCKIVARNINTLSQKRNQNQSIWRQYVVWPLIDYFFCNVDCVINQCEGMQNDLLEHYPKLKNKSVVIYNPVSKRIEKYAENLDRNNTDVDDYLLYIGSLEKQKAVHNAITAFSRITNHYPNIRLKIVGKGSLENELKLLAVQLMVEDKVDFEGFQYDVIPYFINARGTMLTSLYEGFPNVLVESITLGTPVISFNCPSGPEEIIIPDVNGYLVENQNVDDLVVTLDKFLNKKWSHDEIMQSATQFKSVSIIRKYCNVLVDH